MSVNTRSITTATDTPTTTDSGKLLRVDYNGNCAMTLNNTAWTEGQWFSTVVEHSNGSITFTASGTTLLNGDSTLVLNRQYGSATCMYAGSNEWWIWPPLGETHDYRGINSQTDTAHTLVADDFGKLISVNPSGNFTLTVPPESSVDFPDGTKIDVLRLHATNTLTIAAGSGVTVNGTLTVGSQYHVTSLIKYGTNLWVHVGGS